MCEYGEVVLTGLCAYPCNFRIWNELLSGQHRKTAGKPALTCRKTRHITNGINNSTD